MKVLVCGGRDFDDAALMERILNEFHSTSPITVIVEGGAMGADTLARQWAIGRQIEVETCNANWALYGGAAGPIRNQYMIDVCRPHSVIAFPGGRGTADMVRRARVAGLPVLEVSRA